MAETIKNPPTTNTAVRSGSVAATAAIGPNLIKPLLDYLCEIIRWAAPTFPVPSDDFLWSAATIICGIGAGAIAFFYRGTRLDRRASDPQPGGDGI